MDGNGIPLDECLDIGRHIEKKATINLIKEK